MIKSINIRTAFQPLLNFIFLALCCLSLFSSCSDKYNSLYDAAVPPLLSFNKDTMHIREKDYSGIIGWVNPILWMHSIPSLPQLNIFYSDTSGKVHFTYRGTPMQDSKPIIVAGDSTSLWCSCDTAGVYRVDFYLTDQLGKISYRPFIVNCLANDKAKPDLFLELVDSSSLGNWYYRFDATKTEKKYGRLAGFYFTVNGSPVFSRTAVLDWVFHNRGEQLISLYVVDDLGLHSDTITQKTFIP
jgi:hypothetical protein